VQDIGMFVDVAKAHDILTACDNSWATPLNFKPLDHGIDIAIMSATKYISGHSDAMLGVVSCKTETIYKRVLTAIRQTGNCPGSEEVYLGLRGLRTLDVRMKQHTASGLALGQWLSDHPAVKTVLHPAFSSSAGHQNWQKYFTGTSGVFAIVLHETDPDKIGNMLDHLQIFKMGFSWGGYESLVFPEQLSPERITKPWSGDGFLLRIHPGLEAVEDLQNDLESALSRLG
jgi:cystathionine beta-lyase